MVFAVKREGVNDGNTFGKPQTCMMCDHRLHPLNGTCVSYTRTIRTMVRPWNEWYNKIGVIWSI